MASGGLWALDGKAIWGRNLRPQRPDAADESRIIEILPQEERENRFRVVLDNISDGVVSIGKGGQVTTINRMALRALNRQAKEVVGTDVRSLNLPDHTILDLWI